MADLIGLAVVFLILALIAYILGARGIAGFSMEIAKWLVIIFIILAIITFFFRWQKLLTSYALIEVINRDIKNRFLYIWSQSVLQYKNGCQLIYQVHQNLIYFFVSFLIELKIISPRPNFRFRFYSLGAPLLFSRYFKAPVIYQFCFSIKYNSQNKE